jgi:hypothetical protein
MCDFSLHHVKSRPAKVGDTLRTVYFNTGTRGFAAPEDSTTAVSILPGIELAFSEEVKCNPTPFGFSSWRTKTVNYRTAIFRQVNKDQPRVHHDALEFPDGTSVLLTDVLEGQEATVLQLPTQPKTPAEEVAERRVIYIAEGRRSSGIKPRAAVTAGGSARPQTSQGAGDRDSEEVLRQTRCLPKWPILHSSFPRMHWNLIKPGKLPQVFGIESAELCGAVPSSAASLRIPR